MVNKLFLLLFLISPLLSNSQEYVDLLNLSYSKTGDTSFENSSEHTTISIFDSKVTLPIVLNEKTALITGFDFNIKKLQLLPYSNFSKLYYTRLKLGFSTQHSDRWTGTYILLPILASDYKNIGADDIYMGGIAVWTYKKRKNLEYILVMKPLVFTLLLYWVFTTSTLILVLKLALYYRGFLT